MQNFSFLACLKVAEKFVGGWGVKRDLALVKLFKSFRIILISQPANKHVRLKEIFTLVHTLVNKKYKFTEDACVNEK